MCFVSTDGLLANKGVKSSCRHGGQFTVSPDTSRSNRGDRPMFGAKFSAGGSFLAEISGSASKTVNK
jgi:hypothetical protein